MADQRDHFFYENDRETDKLEGFADDGTVLALASEPALAAIKEILHDFKNISGLGCNLEKSVILPIGFNNTPVPDYFYNSGFRVVSKVTILGATITNNPNDLAKNFDGKVQKITNICNHWSRFRLSLPGRILVAKTFMLSQIGYLGCIIQTTRDQI
jgi:hypothetical protein